MNFAVIGGDMRQAKLAELLAEDGHAVTAFAIDEVKTKSGVRQTETAKDAVAVAECIIFPLPMSLRAGLLNAPLSGGQHAINDILSEISPTQVAVAGRIDDASRELADALGVSLVDYLEREEFAIANAVAAAEGAIGIIMEETPATVSGAKCLVIGFGRISKILCHRLRGLGAQVTASARSFADLAWIGAYGYRATETARLDGTLRDYDVVINTVPARVLGDERLMELKKGCLCLDLASKPGGMDFSAASRLGVRAMWALGLPGEVAPVTSGAIIRDTVYNILTEKGRKP